MDTNDQPSAEVESVPVADLRIGTRLVSAVFDDRGILLLAEGSTITTSFLRKLASRGLKQVRIREEDLETVYAFQPRGTARETFDERADVVCPWKTATTLRLDIEIATLSNLELEPQRTPFVESFEPPRVAVYDDAEVERFLCDHRRSVREVDNLFARLSSGDAVDTEVLAGIADEALANLAADPDLFACLGITAVPTRYPARHGMHVSMLAMAIGARLGFDRETLRDLSVGCLLHDAGMLQVGTSAYTSSDILTEKEFREIVKHPIHTLEMIASSSEIPQRSKCVVYQMHERCNGSGYPRGRKGHQIHALARIAAVADAFVGMVTSRPHRPGLLPYKALERIIHGVHDGLFDASATRGLLQCVSLFPVGSYIQLSDGRQAKVVRSNSIAYHRPIVEIWRPNRADGTPELVNLAKDDSIEVLKPLGQCAPNLQQDAADAPSGTGQTSDARETPVRNAHAPLPLDAVAIEDSWS